jgi:hypothetical protein
MKLYLEDRQFRQMCEKVKFTRSNATVLSPRDNQIFYW